MLKMCQCSHFRKKNINSEIDQLESSTLKSRIKTILDVKLMLHQPLLQLPAERKKSLTIHK